MSNSAAPGAGRAAEPDPESGRAGRIKDLVSRAIALPQEQRQDFIAHECAGDILLALQVRDFVAAHEAAGSFMSSPTRTIAPTGGVPAGAASTREGPGTRIGPYKLLELIGEGGFG